MQTLEYVGKELACENPSADPPQTRKGLAHFIKTTVQRGIVQLGQGGAFSYAAGPKTILRGSYGIYSSTQASFSGIGNLFYNAPIPSTFHTSTAAPISISATASPFQVSTPFRSARGRPI